MGEREKERVCVRVCVCVCVRGCVCMRKFTQQSEYGMASSSRLLKIIGLFCKRAL